MFSNKCYIILSIYLFIHLVNAIRMSKNDVLQIKLKRQRPKSCPSYSDGYSSFSCEYHFYCREEECSTKDKKTLLVEFTSKNGTIETFIPDTCREEDFKMNLCSTSKCYDNDDCLSNKCLNRTCMVNDESPVIECTNRESYKTLKFKYTTKMKCGKSNFEKCTIDDDCVSKNCTETGYCFHTFVNHKYDQIFYQIFEICAIIFICMGIILCICCLTCCYRHKIRKNRYSF